MIPTAMRTTVRWSVAGICGWETFAITTHRVPTVSALCAHHRYLVPVILGGLGWHLLARLPESSQELKEGHGALMPVLVLEGA